MDRIYRIIRELIKTVVTVLSGFIFIKDKTQVDEKTETSNNSNLYIYPEEY